MGEPATLTQFLEPGNAWEKGHVRRFDGRLRDKLLTREISNNLPESQVLVQRWGLKHRQRCPHSPLGSRPPAHEAYGAALGARLTAAAAYGLP